MARNYDPVKRREYYLRTRKLKGRKRAAKKIIKTNTPNLDQFSTGFFNRLNPSEKQTALTDLIGKLKTAHENWVNTHSTDQFKPGTPEWKTSQEMVAAIEVAEKALEEIKQLPKSDVGGGNW